ncbi:1-acyl-sn-glycerol-3-phosphate acyltransferase [bacterium]|nr:1-acyl-sn-glycerol-3-phosphate acyltransferase [bacterium]
MFYSFASITCFILFKLLFGLRVEGEENIPKKGPAIIAPNHISFLDPVAIGAAIRRPIYYMARDDLFAIPVLGWLIRHLNAFPVKRGSPDPKAIKKAFRILRRGDLLLVFPEGRRSLDGKLQPGHPGAGMLTFRSRAPVIPTLIVGSERALPVDAHWIRTHRIKIRFGKPIFLKEFPEPKNRRQAYQAISDKIIEEIKKLTDGD